MVQINSFKGYLYNTDITGNISRVIAPPWDVIDDEAEEKLYSSSEWNVIKIISQKISPPDANSSFQEMINKNILIQDKTASFYYLKHSFFHNGEVIERLGTFALLKIEDFQKGNIIPHEHVFEKYHTNRYKLIKECHANFSPVFMLYNDKENKLEDIIGRTPTFLEGNLNGDKLKFGRIDNPEDIKIVTDTINSKKLFIADGHHRYQAAFRFFTDNPDEKNSRLLIFLSNLNSPGLMILPTHRYLPYDVSFADNLHMFEKYFLVEKVGGLEDMSKKMLNNLKKHIFGVYEKNNFYLITLKEDKNIIQSSNNNGHSEEWLSLDNVLLQNIIFDKILQLSGKEIFYSASAEYLLNEYSIRKKGVIFFVNPISKESFLKISLNGEKMPQKSTYFYPKVPTGLVIHKF